MQSSEAPIGLFDSGVGGLTVRAAVTKLLPHESTIYIADREHCPYGPRIAEEIREFARGHVRRLLELNCKLIVVACNTATAAAIDVLRAEWPEVPFVGMEPAVKPAALKSRTGVVGVLATEGTFHGRLYQQTCERFAKGVNVLMCVADDFVTLVERNELTGERAEKIVRSRVEPLLAAGADHLVLGCTHFPFLLPLIEQVVAGRATIIEPSAAVARQVKKLLAARQLLAPSTHTPIHQSFGL